MFSTLDWSILLIYLTFSFGMGLLMTRKASKSLESYFVADRSLPWWWLGTSMVATTFAADTPLAITGIIAKDGIAGNWFWWSWVLMYVTMSVLFARKWRASEVLTDVELIELRYDGKAAEYLRAFKAFFFSIIINCIILGWVFRAMSKITGPFLDWEQYLGTTYTALAASWPTFLLFDNVNNTITVLVVFVIVIIYSSLGGIRGVILTDLFQFALAIGAAIIFAVYAVNYVGGLDGLYTSLENLYPQNHNKYTDFFPSFDDALLPFKVFLIYIFIQFWSQIYSDGSGFYAQRMNTARTPADAQKGALWFTIANFGIRTWPWVMVGLVALVVFPLDNPTQFHEMGAELNGDREMAYPVLMKLILPSGLLGLMFTSLVAAFMSTVDTHINWGASYLVNDFYKRFINPDASNKDLVLASRTAVLAISIIAIIIATQISSIEGAWKFFMGLGSGLGMAHILRWVWWRANAWTEIVAMVSGLLFSLVVYPLFPDVRSEYLLFFIATGSAACAIIATFVTPPVSEVRLMQFIEKVKPFGFWQGRVAGINQSMVVKRLLFMWVLATLVTFAAMFSVGYILKMQYAVGTALFIFFIVGLIVLLRMMGREERLSADR